MKKILLAILAVLLILLTPIPAGTLKDGGTKVYRSLTYKLVVWNRLQGGAGGIFHKVTLYFPPEAGLSVDELWQIELEHMHQETPMQNEPESNPASSTPNAPSVNESPTSTTTEAAPVWSAIAPEGDTLETRILTPEGYERTEIPAGSFAEYVRKYKMKPDGSYVLLHNGLPKFTQSDHVAVFALPIEERDLQQCADSIMRFYGEYCYKNGYYDKLKYPMGGGFVGDFAKWKKGYSIGIKNDKLYWKQNSKSNGSYESFVKFMQVVFAYSGTMNMEDAAKAIQLEDATIGDIFIKGGSPGHVVMIVDVCQDADGHKAYLLGQGYMPAQEFHVIKNPLHEEDPWYYEDEIVYPLETAEYTFPKECLKRIYQ